MARYKAKAYKNLIIALAVLLLAAVLTVVAAIGSLGFTNKDFKTWFNNWGSAAGNQNEQNETRTTWGGAVDGDGNEMNNKATYAMPATMAFYATVEEDIAHNLRLSSPSVMVTCSHNFEFNNIKVDWSVEYPSGASATDIITVTPASDGSTTASVQCSGAFDRQIMLKATLRGHTEKVATCTIDYVKRLAPFNYVAIHGTDFDDGGGVYCSPNFTTGTVTGRLRVSQISYCLLGEFTEAVQSYLKFEIQFKSYTEGNLMLNEMNYSADTDAWTYSKFIYGFDEYDSAHKNAIYYAWNAAFEEGKYIDNKRSTVLLDFDIDLLYNGKLIASFSETNYVGTGSMINYLSGSLYGSELAPDLTLNNGVVL